MAQPDDDIDPDFYKIKRWVTEIELYDRETEKWRNQSKRILLRYKDQRQQGRDEDNASRYNVLWSNTQTLQPALYARNPKADIQRRFKDADPVGRVTSTVLERSVEYFIDTDKFASTMRQCVVDFLLPGRGTTWVRYVPHMRTLAPEVTNEAEEAEAIEEIEYEEVIVDYVHTADFGHNICRTWEEVWCGWRIVYMDRAELVKRFGEELGNEIPCDYTAKDLQGQNLEGANSKAVIYELWDKTRGIAVWFHKTMEKALDVRKDPLRLDEFFPFPKPIFANLCNDSLIPTPIYVEYQDQALELDNLTARIASISKSIKVAGVRDASAPGLERLLSEGVDNQLIAVENWAMFAEKGGINGAISWLPLDMIAKALVELYQAREQVKNDLREISGIPDIVRGDSNPNETLGAQQIKVSFATNRISDMQRDIQRFVRQNIRIMVDVICNHFQLETIKKISGVRLLTQQEKMIGQQMVQQAQQTGQPPQLPPGIDMDTAEQLMSDPTWEEVDQLIRDNALRCFRIDIETDSTIKADEEQDKASATEMIKAVGGYLEQAQQAGAQQPEMIPLLGQILMFYMRRFPVGKELEGSMETALKKLEKQAKNPQPRPDPEMAKIQAESQIQQQKMQGEMRQSQQQAQLDIQIENAKLQSSERIEATKAQQQAAVDQHLNQLEAQRRQLEIQAETQMQLAKAESEERIEKMKLDSEQMLELKKALIQQETAIVVARISAKASTGQVEEGTAYSRDAEIDDPFKDKVLHSKLDQLTGTLDKMSQDHVNGIGQLVDAHTRQMDAHSKAVENMARNHAEGLTQLAQVHNMGTQALHRAITDGLGAEKEVVRDPKTGKPTGVRVKARGVRG